MFMSEWRDIGRGNEMWICKKPLTYEEMTIDHIIPLCEGGNHTEDNVCAAHMECNTWKSGFVERIHLDYIHGIP